MRFLAVGVGGCDRVLGQSPSRLVARGLVNFGAEELPAMLGRRSSDLAADLGAQYEREIVHRDSLILLNHVADS
ncbi:hypothetical protein [Propionimicrobium sp. PCR01-08-3]|uniref:hypothetical protein n=1 Tax=Propionimicrobium sp. PCR01-08-3 TaxID=3052086 RepID=UPI00255C4401|nr:hypothetical protein [Propionimicrobium sp. PCR01-08-3]WIY83528.1 hypothetical protein QQ658_04000 [Propionimicrobium sp. PCR01-08-3]